MRSNLHLYSAELKRHSDSFNSNLSVLVHIFKKFTLIAKIHHEYIFYKFYIINKDN